MSCRSPEAAPPQELHRPPRIEPDYTDTVIPPNIAPLNFVIREEACRYRVDIAGLEGQPIVIDSTKPGIQIPLSGWKDLLARNKGKEIHFIVSVQASSGQWVRFDAIRNRVAQEDVDGYLIYRLMPPLYVSWGVMAIYERNLANFSERALLRNEPLNNGCFNCHSFLHNSPEKWIVHLRGAPATGMLLSTGRQTALIKTQTDLNKTPAGHAAWHPSGKFLAFSVYRVRQFFHAAGPNRDVLDYASDLILYDVDSNTVSTCASIADPGRFETYPAWSADGRWLYFSSAPAFDTATVLRDENYKAVRYDLMRIAFDPRTAAFGKLETFLASSETGMSITFPRFSPDGRYLLFTMSEYGNFPVARSNGDLYLLDMQSRAYRRLDAVNSDRPESYHSWSSNGRWFVFSSKREDGISARPYFSYFDGQGNAHKPFVLPQRDPAFYESTLETFNIPELVTGPIPQRPQELLRAALQTHRSLQARSGRRAE